MEIKIENYLNHDEIKETVQDELRRQVRKHFENEENAKRLLSNLAYHIVQEDVDKIIPNYENELITKVISLLNNKDISYHLYNFHYDNGKAVSAGAKIIEQTVLENKDIIKQKVIDSILNKDYSEQAWNKFESLAEDFKANIYDFVEQMRKRK
jgi:hypothetical protein